MEEKIKPTIADVVKVERHGTALVVPENMPTKNVIAALQAWEKSEEQDVAVMGDIDGIINEGCYAFYQVLQENFGFANGVPTPGMFGDTPPIMRTVRIGLEETIQIPWGRFQLPGIEGWVGTGVQFDGKRFYFQIIAQVKRRYEKIVQKIIDDVQARVKAHPIYAGKAFRIRFRDDDGEWITDPNPVFIPTNPRIMEELVFSADVQEQITNSIFTPIRHSDLVRKAGGSLKRGILLSGTWGTGKSMTSAATANLAIENGWTFIVCENPRDLEEVLRLGAMYGPCVVFQEDIDSILAGDRDIDMNGILEVIDGVDSKDLELMVVLTTNYVEKINRAMLRPGRLDAVIPVLPPDAEAVQRLLRLYGRGLIAEGTDLTDIGERLAGNIPAVIREVVERSKLAAIAHSPNYDTLQITHDDLVSAAASMQMQLSLLVEPKPDLRSAEEKAADVLATPLARLADALTPVPFAAHD